MRTVKTFEIVAVSFRDLLWLEQEVSTVLEKVIEYFETAEVGACMRVEFYPADSATGNFAVVCLRLPHLQPTPWWLREMVVPNGVTKSDWADLVSYRFVNCVLSGGSLKLGYETQVTFSLARR